MLSLQLTEKCCSKLTSYNCGGDCNGGGDSGGCGGDGGDDCNGGGGDCGVEDME